MCIERSHPRLSLRRQCRLLSLSRSVLYYTPTGENAENHQTDGVDRPAILGDALVPNTGHGGGRDGPSLGNRWYSCTGRS